MIYFLFKKKLTGDNVSMAADIPLGPSTIERANKSSNSDARP
jgi:hypothetical protein